MPTPQPHDLPTQLEAQRIKLAANEYVIGILTSDLAKANIANEGLRQQLAELTPKPDKPDGN